MPSASNPRWAASTAAANLGAYDAVSLRMAAVWKIVGREFVGASPWLVRIWDDNFVFAEGVVRTINSLDTVQAGINPWVDPYILGRIMKMDQTAAPQAFPIPYGGAGYVQSAGALSALLALLPGCVASLEAAMWAPGNRSAPSYDRYFTECMWCEDLIFSWCTERAGLGWSDDAGGYTALQSRRSRAPSPPLPVRYMWAQGFSYESLRFQNESWYFQPCRFLACRRPVQVAKKCAR